MLYLLPLKARADDDLSELAAYLETMSAAYPVLVVDGSSPDVFARNAAIFRSALHVAPDPDLRCQNPKVAGVLTGLRRCDDDTVVIADDDVRYGRAEIDRLSVLLTQVDLVVPQNYYLQPAAATRWDTARILINRALPSGDFPGTLGLRLSDRMRRLGYDGNVLFENLELIRTVIADGGTVLRARDMFVSRKPPTWRHFVGQRIRQAYDSQAQPLRLTVELALLPVAVLGRRRPVLWGVLASGAVVTAAAGRHRDHGARYFPASAVWLAPGWLAERAVCAWLAVGARLLGGVPYAGSRLLRAASPVSRLRRDRAQADDCRRTRA